MHLITHRGFFHDNKAMGVLYSLVHPLLSGALPWSETDLLWTGKNWVLCHDHEALRKNRIVDPLSVLVDGLVRLRHRRWRLILDVKWDNIHNRQDCLSDAVHDLKRIIEPLEGCDILLQASDTPVFRALSRDLSFATGLLLSGGFLDVSVLPVAGFYTIDLHSIHEQDVRFIRDRAGALLVGFTCHKVDDLPRYSHLFHLLDGIVCIRR
jgi:hypothetical protein